MILYILNFSRRPVKAGKHFLKFIIFSREIWFTRAFPTDLWHFFRYGTKVERGQKKNSHGRVYGAKIKMKYEKRRGKKWNNRLQKNRIPRDPPYIFDENVKYDRRRTNISIFFHTHFQGYSYITQFSMSVAHHGASPRQYAPAMELFPHKIDSHTIRVNSIMKTRMGRCGSAEAGVRFESRFLKGQLKPNAFDSGWTIPYYMYQWP